MTQITFRKHFIRACYSLLLTLVLFCSCQKENLLPVANPGAFPIVADSTILIEFNSDVSSKNSLHPGSLMFSWDFESDNQWDILNTNSPISTHRYSKSGIYKVAFRAMNHDGLCYFDSLKITIVSANHFVGQLEDERDGSLYKTVRINNRWWMAENLDYGSLITDEQEQVDNQIVEKYYFKNDSLTYSSFGGIYRWEEALNYSSQAQGICPHGWHIPSNSEWQSVLTNIDPWYAWQYYGQGGLSKFNIHAGLFASREYGTISWVEDRHSHWSRDYYQLDFLRERAPYVFDYKMDWGSIGLNYVQVLYDGSDGLFVESTKYASIRCIKDE